MDRGTYITLMESRLEEYFSTTKEYTLLGEKFDLYGACNMQLGRTFLTKQDIVDRYDTNEYVCIKYCEQITPEVLGYWLAYSKQLPEALVRPHEHHRSTYINLVLYTEQVDLSPLKQLLKKHKVDKFYKFYLQGFSEVRLLVISLADEIVGGNKASHVVKKVYQPTLYL